MSRYLKFKMLVHILMQLKKVILILVTGVRRMILIGTNLSAQIARKSGQRNNNGKKS